MAVSNNMAAASPALRNYSAANAASAKSMQNIASGRRINSAADDAAGLAISTKMNAQITGISRASQNAQDAVSMVQTADAVLGSVSGIMNRMNELTVQAGSGALGDTERAMLQEEFSQLAQEIDRIGQASTFNGQKLFDGSTYTMQTGENPGDTRDITMGVISSAALGLDQVDLRSVQSAGASLEAVKGATGNVSSQRSNMGAVENGLRHTINNLGNREENLTASVARMAGADIAKEAMNLSISNTLSQVSMAVMRNAQNMMQQNVVNLLLT